MHAADASIAAIAGRQDNVISHEQLARARGRPRRRSPASVERGRWQRLHRGVYLIGPAPPTLAASARAALLTLRGGRGHQPPHRRGAVGLLPTGRAMSTSRSRAVTQARATGVRTHRVTDRSPFDEVTVRDGLPTHLPRPHDLRPRRRPSHCATSSRALAEARVQRLATDRADRRGHRTRPDAQRAHPSIRSCSEPRTTPATPAPKQNAACAASSRSAASTGRCSTTRLLGYEVDFLWPEQRLVVEVDGYSYHGHRRGLRARPPPRPAADGRRLPGDPRDLDPAPRPPD